MQKENYPALPFTFFDDKTDTTFIASIQSLPIISADFLKNIFCFLHHNFYYF